MRRVHRARLALIGASLGAIAVLAFELPLSTILHQRSEVASASVRLSAIEQENGRLTGAISSLQKDGTVAALAHADYGLIKVGQLAYAILPVKGSTGSGTLAGAPIGRGDLVAATASPFGTSSASATATRGSTALSGSVWSRLLDHLEFWRGTF